MPGNSPDSPKQLRSKTRLNTKGSILSRSVTNVANLGFTGGRSSSSLDNELEQHDGEFYAPKDIIPYLQRIPTQEYLDYLEDKTSHDHGCVRCANKLLEMPGVSAFMCTVILLNMVVLVIETDQHASSDGDKGDFTWTTITGWIVLGIFVFELIVRIIALRKYFWFDMSNVFDFLIVTLDASLSIVAAIAGSTFPLSILRIFRLAKFARVSKVLLFFPELRLLLAGLISAMSAIFWGTILLGFCLIVWSMGAVLFINPLNKNIEYENCERCGRAYSSVMHASLTFWQSIVTGDSWGETTIPLIEKHPSTACFFVAVYLTIGMAVTNLILGVVVSVAQQARQDLIHEDSTLTAMEKLQKKSHLLELCKELDLDHDGLLDKSELVEGFSKEGPFREAVLALNVEEEDLDMIWGIVDPDHKGAVSYKELVSQLATLRSSDSQFMLSYIKYNITTLRHKLMSQIKDFHVQTMRHETFIAKEVQEVKDKEDAILAEEKKLGQMALKVEEELHTIELSRALLHQAASEPDTATEQMEKLSKIRQTARTDDSHGASSAMPIAASLTVDKPAETWVQRVCDEVDKVRVELADILRLELKEILKDIDSKLGPRAFRDSAGHQIMSPTQTEMMVLSSSLPDAKPSCCSFPVCYRAVQPEQRHVLGTAPETIPEAKLPSAYSSLISVPKSRDQCIAKIRPEEGG